MSSDFSIAEARELHRLCGSWVDRHISVEDFDILCQWLRRSGDARRFYVEYLDLHAQLGRQFRQIVLPPGFPTSQAAASEAIATAPAVPQLVAAHRSPVLGFLATATRWVPGSESGIGALVILAVVAGFVGLVTAYYTRHTAPDPSDNGQAVARITASEDAKWQASDPTTAIQPSAFSIQHSEVSQGKPLNLASGTVRLNLQQGTAVVIEGPADWTVVNGNRIKLRRGKLLAHVPRQAIGFTVETPTSEIVDLGTRFVVEVASGGMTNVNVLQGLVDATPLNARSATVRLSARQAARIAPESQVAESIPYDDSVATSFGEPDSSGEPPPSELPTLPQLTKTTLLFGDNFSLLQPSREINPGTCDAAQRQTGLLAPLRYQVTSGNLAASARLGDPPGANRLLLVCDPTQDRTCFGPACNFVQPNHRGGRFTTTFSLQPAWRHGNPAEPSSLWFGVHVGADHPRATMQSAASRIGFQIQGTGSYRVFERHRQRAAGNLADQLSATDLRKPLHMAITLDTAAFDGLTPALVRIKVNDNPLFEQATHGGLHNNYLLFEFLHAQPDICYALSDLRIQFQPWEER